MKRLAIVVVCLVLFAGLLVFSLLDQGRTPEAKQIEAPPITPVPTDVPAAIGTKTIVGETVAFGHYEQDDDPKTEDPLIWYILKVEDGKALLLSQNAIEVMKYYDHFDGTKNAVDDGKQSRWKYSIPREWLNGEFYDKAFSKDEKECILLTNLETDSYDVDRNPIIDITEDHVFCLNATEVEALSEDIRKAGASQHAINQDIYVSGGARYWTCSMAENEYVGYYSSGDKVSFYVPGYERTGVRPAMWISIP